MKSGRKPKPTALKILDGSAAKDPQKVNKFEPQEDDAPPEPLGLNAAEKKVWQRIYEYLDGLGIASKTFEESMALYAKTRVMLDKAEKQVREEGLTIEANTGRVIKNPAVTVMEKQRDVVIRLLAEFGLTPSSKSGLVVKKEKGKSRGYFGDRASGAGGGV